MVYKNNNIWMLSLLLCSAGFVCASEEPYEAPTQRERPDCDYDTPTEYVLGALGVAVRVNVHDDSVGYWEKHIEQDGSRMRIQSAQILDVHGKRDYFGTVALDATCEGDGEEHKVDAQIVNNRNTVEINAVLTSCASRTLGSAEEREEMRRLIEKKGAKKEWSEQDHFVMCDYDGSIALTEGGGKVVQQIKTFCEGTMPYDAFLALVSYKGVNMHDLVRQLSQ